MIPAVVFSRNRACQLDALLSSLETNAPGVFFTTVLFRADTDDYMRGYLRCVNDHPDVGFQRERNFADQLTSLIPMAGPNAFFVDDDIVYRKVPFIPELHKDWACFSLRLGNNTTWCYPHQRRQTQPKYQYRRPPRGDVSMACWPWREMEGDFSYPASLDGHIFDSDLIRAFFLMRHPDSRFDQYTNPNELEDFMAARFVTFGKPALMASFAQSCVVGVPANTVTETHTTNRVMDAPNASMEKLNEMYLDGWRIAWQDIDYSEVNAAHCELHYPLVKELK